ncbi:MAG: hypothetical protein IT454_23280 [Planctomycetes bacterium]|nr:hypothetical protein [Planctomycetota bacterium]
MNRFATALLALPAVAGIASAQYDELSLTGAGPRLAYALDRGTATGLVGDVVTFNVAGGATVSTRPISWWCNQWLAGDPRVQNVVFHSGGQISIQFNLYSFSNYLGGGSYSIRRNGAVIDKDPIL